jgi:hypothetical protein
MRRLKLSFSRLRVFPLLFSLLSFLPSSHLFSYLSSHLFSHLFSHLSSLLSLLFLSYLFHLSPISLIRLFFLVLTLNIYIRACKTLYIISTERAKGYYYYYYYYYFSYTYRAI